MKFTSKVKRISILSSMLSLILIIIIMGSSVFYVSHERFKKEAKDLREEYYNDEMELIKNEIYKTYDYVQYSKSKTKERLKKEIKNNVYETYEIVSNIYENNKYKSKEQIEKIIGDTLRNIKFKEGSEYYFAIKLDGTAIIYPVQREIEGLNFLTLEDEKFRHPVEEMTEFVKSQGEGFYEYMWTKPNKEGNKHKKISFVKYFKPLDMYIGTGLYIDDVEEEVKKEVLDRISKITYKNNGYIFVTTYEGKALVFAQQELIGKDVSNIKDINNVEIHNEEMKVINVQGEGFIRYVWPKPNKEGVYPKITFVKGINQWKWVLGTGVYVDEIEKIIEIKKLNLQKGIKSTILNASLILLLIGGIVILIQVYLLKGAEEAIKAEEKIYEILTNLSEDGIFILEPHGKILEANKKGLKMISCSKEEVSELNFKELIKESLFENKIIELSKETYLKNKDNETMPIELHIKSIEVNKKNIFIAYARDLTKRKLYEETLKQRAITDELTNVYNRRFIISQLKSEIQIVKEIGNSISLVLFDIDKFKNVNDSYGHVFGDKVLKVLCKTFKDNLRDMDCIGRYGGEEFMVILPNTYKDSALKIIKDIKDIFTNLKWEEDENLKITFSAGILEININNSKENITDYIEEVDKLLYKAKENGRNRIET